MHAADTCSTCPIFIGNNNAIDTKDKEPDPSFDTALKVLQVSKDALYVTYLLTLGQIDNDLARKQLIIGQNIDQSILIENRGVAIDTMNSARLPNVKQCFTLIKKTGEGLRMNYGYGGVGCPPW